MAHRRDLTLVLVRHGETEGESSIRYHGRNDVVLSELGRAQMVASREEIESRFGHGSFDHIFATPLSRAMEGARIISGVDASIVAIEEFIEVHFGLFEGLTKEEIQERHPIEFEKWRADPLAPVVHLSRGRKSRSLCRARRAWSRNDVETNRCGSEARIPKPC